MNMRSGVVMDIDITVPLIIIPLFMLDRKDTTRITAHALYTCWTSPLNLTLGLFSMAHLTSLNRYVIWRSAMLDSPQTGVHRNSGTRDDKRNPLSGAVLSILQNPWTMSSGKMTGSLPWWRPVVDCVGVMNVHAKTIQKKKKNSPQRKWRGLAGDLYSLFRSLLDVYLYLRGRCSESSGKEKIICDE